MPESTTRMQIPATVIDRELSFRGIRLRFDDDTLEQRYRHEADENTRLHNRVTIGGLVLLFDLFILPEIDGVPEMLTLSLWLRFAILTPLTLLYILLDWRGWLGSLTKPMVTFLAFAPTLFACLEVITTVSPAALPNIQAIPLIQLVALTSRLTLLQSAIANSLSCLVYILAISVCPAVPAAFLPSMILTDLAILIAVIAFAVRVDLRERKVFLLVQQAERRRAVLAAENTLLTELSQIDALTGLANRRAFEETLDRAWAEAMAKGQPLGLIILDVDHFKRFNDYYGHQSGDRCLRNVAQAARSQIRSEDLIARYGGEEFAVILPNAEIGTVTAVAERIQRHVEAMGMPHGGIGLRAVVTVSLGAASILPGASLDPSSLIETADRNLYTAKWLGRNRVESGTPPPGQALAS